MSWIENAMSDEAFDISKVDDLTTFVGGMLVSRELNCERDVIRCDGTQKYELALLIEGSGVSIMCQN